VSPYFGRDLTRLGWTEGGNINVDYRWVGGDAARAKASAAELVSQKPDVIIANSTLSLAAIRNEAGKWHKADITIVLNHVRFWG
jgi:ABC-type glycerol-3-phosphate transport system substrate-binding protein